MVLKKIDSNLQKAIEHFGEIPKMEFLQTIFPIFKSGQDAVIFTNNNAQLLFAIIAIIQKLKSPEAISPRALVIVNDKQTLMDFETLFNALNTQNQLRGFFTHEKTDLDQDKNLISVGIDVLIGTPEKLNTLYSTAGFDINRLNIFTTINTEMLLKNRYENILARLSEAAGKMQRIYFAKHETDKLTMFTEKTMIEHENWFFEEDVK